MRIAPLVVAVVFLAVPISAQPLTRQADTYGTASLTWATVGAFEFKGEDSSSTYAFTTMGLAGIYRTAGTANFHATVHLPEGASVSSMELSACDFDPMLDVQATFFVYPKTPGMYSSPGFVSTSGSSGCQVVSATFMPWLVNNDQSSYDVRVNLPVANATGVLNSVRIGYKLQVSPAPMVATFSDVPSSHPFFQYIEALAASGITAGCTAPPNPQYCPDATLTRGQMAVFLSRALGLHWAP